MSLILQELRRAQFAAGFRDSWEWRKLEASDSRRAEFDAGHMSRVEHAPPGHDDVPASDEVDGDEAGHDGKVNLLAKYGQE